MGKQDSNIRKKSQSASANGNRSGAKRALSLTKKRDQSSTTLGKDSARDNKLNLKSELRTYTRRSGGIRTQKVKYDTFSRPEQASVSRPKS